MRSSSRFCRRLHFTASGIAFLFSIPDTERREEAGPGDLDWEVLSIDVAARTGSARGENRDVCRSGHVEFVIKSAASGGEEAREIEEKLKEREQKGEERNQSGVHDVVSRRGVLNKVCLFLP